MAVFTSCEKRVESINDLKYQKIEINDFFDNIISINVEAKDKNVIYIDYEWNTKDKTIKIIKTDEIEPDFFVLERKLSSKELLEKTYTVTCHRGSSDVWTQKCDGKFSCGALISKCLDMGECATICLKEMIYLPATHSFILLDK